MSELRTSEQKNFNCIDLVKFICSILIISIHYPPLGESSTGIIKLLNFGVRQYVARVAVPFFFIASGFLLFRKCSLKNFNVQRPKNYIIRIAKLYLLWSIIYLPININSIVKSKSILRGIIAYLRNIFLVGSYWQLWYLNALIVSVIVVTFLLYKEIKPNTIVVIGLILYAIGLLAQSYYGLILPLKELSPQLWKVLKLIQKVISTSRNAFFFGLLFVSIGMCIAFYKPTLSKKTCVIGLVVSFLLLGAEVFVLESSDFIRAHDMYIMLIPEAFFLFCLAKEAQLPDNKIYKDLRFISSLIFYSHTWVIFVVNNVLKIMGKSFRGTWIQFALIVLLTLIFSITVYKLSQKDRFKFLTKLYI